MNKLFAFLALVAGCCLVACDSDSGTSANESGEGGNVSGGGSCSVEPKACPESLVEGTICDSRDGTVYKVTKIGDMTWLAENLRYYDCNMDKTWCYDNKQENCEKYGRLYSWTAAMGLDKSFQKKFADLKGPTQGACPEGFHIPNYDEWNLLDSLVEAEYGYVSPSLRSKTGWTERDYPATDTTGFGALPAGKRWLSKFDDLGEKTIFWTAITAQLP